MMQRFAVEIADAYLIWTRYRQLSLSVEFTGSLCPNRIRQAMVQIVNAHPILRCRLVETWWRASWEPLPTTSVAETVTVRSWDSSRATGQNWAAEPLDVPVQVIIGQGVSDLLIFKLDHALGDFEALIQLVYALADTVTRLENDPGYVLPPVPIGERGFADYCRRLPWRERRRMFHSGLKTIKEMKTAGRWRLPAHLDSSEPTDSVQLFHSFERSTVEQLEAFGRKQSATLFQVVLAAYFLTLCDILPDSDEVLQILVPVSLRRRIPNYHSAVVANQVAPEFVFLRRCRENTLESVMTDVQSHFQARRSAPFAEGITPLWFETIPPPFNWLRWLIPDGWQRTRFQRQFDRDLTTRERGTAMATTIGDLNPRRLKFGSVSPTFAMGSGHPTLSRRLFQLGMSGFDGTVTVTLGFGPQDEMEQLRRVFLKTLEPALATNVDGLS